MSSKEFAEWLAFDYISPGEPERGDLRAARTCQVIANCNRTKKTKPFSLEMFLLKFGPKRVVRKTAKEIKMKLLVFKNMFSAQEKK